MEVVADHEVRSERGGDAIDACSGHRRHGFSLGCNCSIPLLPPADLQVDKWETDDKRGAICLGLEVGELLLLLVLWW